MKIACSACLLGINCKYNGHHNLREDWLQSLSGQDILPICPETAAGLSCPRIPSEQLEDAVIDKNGNDLTGKFHRGADLVLEQIKRFEPDLIYLKSKSPSCGVGKVYDGTFSSTLKNGNGVLTEKLLKEGYSPIAID